MKDTITLEDMILMLESMNPANSSGDLIRLLDASVTSEDMYYHHQRMMFHKKSSKTKITMGQAAAIMLKEEKVQKIGIALAMFGYCSFHLGHSHAQRIQHGNDDIVKEALDKLANDLGAQVKVVKVDIAGLKGVLKKEAFKPKDDGEVQEGS